MKKELYGNSLYEDETTDYSNLLEASSAAFRAPIHRIIAWLNLEKGMNILDVGAGIGQDMIDMAGFVAPTGKIVGLEIARPHFEKAAGNARASPYCDVISIYHSDVLCFDCPDELFDVVWCKYTLACFLDPLEALRRMKMLLKEGGRIVVINDLCPMHWLPGTLLGEDRARESRLYSAIFDCIKRYRWERREEYGITGVWNTSCAGLMRMAGFHGIETCTEVAEEISQLSEPLRKVLELFLQRSFSEEVREHLSSDDLRFVETISDPGSPSYLLNRDDLHIIKPITALIGRR